MPYKDEVRQQRYQKQYQPPYQQRYRKGKPRSFTTDYQFYLLIANLPIDDLRALFTIKKQQLRHSRKQDILILRTHLAMIRDTYRQRRQENIDEPLTLQHQWHVIDYYTDQDEW